MQIFQTASFKKTVKKLRKNQKADLDQAVRAIADNPDIGDAKTGDLADVKVYKFKMNRQLSLLAYTYANNTVTLTLLALGTYENFYRDLKR